MSEILDPSKNRKQLVAFLDNLLSNHCMNAEGLSFADIQKIIADGGYLLKKDEADALRTILEDRHIIYKYFDLYLTFKEMSDEEVNSVRKFLKIPEVIPKAIELI